MNNELESVLAAATLEDLRQATERNNRRIRNEARSYVVTQAYTFSNIDVIDSLQVDATAGAITITLPTPNGNRRRRVIKTDGSANAVTLSAGGTILINGATTFALATQYKYVWVEPTGTKWLIIGSN